MIVAAYTVTPEVPAKKNGTCGKCFRADPQIVKDEDYVAKVDGTDSGWLHGDCAHAYARHREDFDRLNRELDDYGTDGAGEENPCQRP